MDDHMIAPILTSNTQESWFIRWMIRRDMPEVLAIEKASFKYFWNEEDFLFNLRSQNCICMVVERESRIIGYMVYVLFKKRICLLKMAVHTNYRRFGVGTKMINKIVKKLSSYRRKGIIIDVRESNLEAQIFLRSLSFKALCVKRNFYSDNGEDSYFFEYKLLDEINPNGVQ